jgi:hypothetical protein
MTPSIFDVSSVITGRYFNYGTDEIDKKELKFRTPFQLAINE